MKTRVIEASFRAFILLSLLLLTACGGGGGGGGGAPTSATTNSSNAGNSGNQASNQQNSANQQNTAAVPGLTVPGVGTVPDEWFVGNDPNSGQLREHTTAEQQTADEVFAQTNAYRMQNGLPALSPDPLLQLTAKVHAEDMARRGYFAHDTQAFQSQSSFDPFERMARLGASYNRASENIAFGQSSPTAVMNAWINSSGHNRNILDANVTHLGVGFATNAQGRRYWVQNFRRGGNAP